jgi:hypothetical protein
MPRLSDISRIPEDGHAKYELRTDDSDASTDGDPGENIRYAAIITLFPSHPSQHRGTNSADQTVVMGFVLTIALFTLQAPVYLSNGIAHPLSDTRSPAPPTLQYTRRQTQP